MTPHRLLPMVCLALIGLHAPSAYAHKIRLFASADGATIAGKAYVSGGGAVVGAAVRALAPDGSELARATTDDQGRFALRATRAVDHRLVLETADGHRATWTVKAGELSGLPDGAAASSDPNAPLDNTLPDPADPNPTVDRPGDDRLSRLIRRAVREETEPLRTQLVEAREQIARYEDRRRLNDLIGGIGYLVGVAGIAFYVLGIKRRAGRP